ncbi:hypothetical protein F53441_14141 [Fusarium austroafricanum]|uniref:Uncharacterized protein n=1 Tax=Fusarium austroafricanum TaxID=2364996 RepID=A0A8H4JJD1_9HYPO|nr:hypothetical protein F53441_14141 [Fusarium austroafricanum]
MAHLHGLPPELVIEIMTRHLSLYDLLPLIEASTESLSCLLVNRQQIILPHVEEIMARLGGNIYSAGLLAARLRILRSQPTFNTLSPTEAQKVIRPLVVRYAAQKEPDGLSCQASLATLCALSTLSRQIKETLDSRPWIKEGIFSREALDTRKHPSDKIQQSIVINAACRFEAYTLAFFRQEEILCDKDSHIRKFFFCPGLDPFARFSSLRDYSKPAFYGIALDIYDDHFIMVYNVLQRLYSENLADRNPSLGLEHLPQEEKYSPLMNVTEFTLHKYVHYLTSQGLETFTRLERMHREDEENFVSRTFNKISLSSHPVAHMVPIQDHPLDTDGYTRGWRAKWHP